MIERRGLLGTLLGAVAAGPSAVKAAVEGMAPALSAPTIPAAELATMARDVRVSEVTARLWPKADGPLRKMLRVLDSRLDDESDARREAREWARAGFEPDIAANPSWSRAYKMHVQNARCLQREHTNRALRDHLYGPDAY